MSKASFVVAPAALLLITLAACSSDAVAPADEEAPPASIAGAASGASATPGSACGKAADNTAAGFARAMGICDDAKTDGFGLVSAKFTRGFDDSSAPPAEQHGVLGRFGKVLKPREGASLGVLSTGFAQEFNGKDRDDSNRTFADGETWWQDETTRTALPAGYPKAAGDCAQSKDLTDVIVLNLTLKAPKTATGLSFDFNFFSSEWPGYICTRFNDGFIAYLTSKGKKDNISFDSKNNPVSVNNGFFDRCTPDSTVGCQGDSPKTAKCVGGAKELEGTGFGVVESGCEGEKVTQGGATGWLTSSAPIEPEETFTLQLAIWDTGDGNLDSSVLLDNFKWVGDKVVTTTTERADDVK